MGYPLTVMVPHSVEILLIRTKTQYLTGARLTRYETSILGAPNVTLKRCTVLDPATLLPSDTVETEKEEDIEHDCLEVTELYTKPRPDIRDTRLEENEQIVFVDGSCLRDGTGTLRAGYAVCTITGTLETSWLPGVYSAQVAELVALTSACYVSARLRLTIYTDNQYVFGIVQDFGQLWLQQRFMTSTGTPVRNGDWIKELLYSIQLPEAIAVVKCSAHQKTQDYISLGNGYADQVARFCALNCILFKDKWELMPEEETNFAAGLKAWFHWASPAYNMKTRQGLRGLVTGVKDLELCRVQMALLEHFAMYQRTEDDEIKLYNYGFFIRGFLTVDIGFIDVDYWFSNHCMTRIRHAIQKVHRPISVPL
ncbi:hypothetical protein NDU88_002375 [Pleurodeles waltl]|uniref:RNase H type-1 domain-containing protein n=1 Tax=Pleurodeles waltl TaxID=8319 RepID=A0AAV7KU02_PLEWA|nr:hypothetical protein NDU88_002375 [Pleurodeles waltl]